MRRKLPPGYKRDGRIDLRMLPEIVERPLLRHGAEGQALQILHAVASGDPTPVGRPRLEIDPRYTGKRRLEIILHEALHLACPQMPETTVGQTARYLTMIAWRLGYRDDGDIDCQRQK